LVCFTTVAALQLMPHLISPLPAFTQCLLHCHFSLRQLKLCGKLLTICSCYLPRACLRSKVISSGTLQRKLQR
jgi:hypothetical protein